ncbi:MAG: leucine--tRNA ligase [Bacteroidia bacterium]|nr:leucine--tRNA ligase [Bacteroidia bacterium]
MEYSFREIEKNWQRRWKDGNTYRTTENPAQPKYYVLDMFPYPSGAGLHVGHPLGYIASDILARYKRHRGFNVLHPMGYDAFGLPAEQYAIQTGQHPAVTTEQNILRFREQLDKIGLSYDWHREVKTCDPGYYKWTQWIFLKLFHSWYNNKLNKTEDIAVLTGIFGKTGNMDVSAACDEDTPSFSAEEWKSFPEKKQQEILMMYRIAYLSEAFVWWCPALGSVLANDEVKEGVSERGGYPVERKKMKQWSMRITAYAQRLLDDLEDIQWSESIKEAQRNWIGKSEGASVKFDVRGTEYSVEVFTTRPDTLFGVTFITLAPEHELVEKITADEQREKVNDYVQYAKARSERERQSEVKKITGAFTGAYAKHPFTGEEIPVWIGEYVLAGYGTGAVMGVPAHDTRDYSFAKHFGLIIKQVINPGKAWDFGKEAYEEKAGKCLNSSFLDGKEVKEAITICIAALEKQGIGTGKVNFRLRDAVFGRQRYWGEPIPIYYKDGIPCPLSEAELPLELPKVDKYLPTETGEPPLARAKEWKYKGQYDYEHTTMPGWAGSSWYFLRYMDPKNPDAFASKKAAEYWREIDFYIGGAEHATGHLLYVRFWTKALYDLGFIPVKEPAKRLVNQGMIQGTSAFVYRKNGTNTFVSAGLRNNFQTTPFHADVSMVEGNELNIEAFKLWREDLKDATFELENGNYIVGNEVEKMSKSKYNVVSPDDMCEKYGADTFRMYEMFLGPLELSKPWNTNGITGVHGFIKKLWKLYVGEASGIKVEEEKAEAKELKVLHKTIKKITDDIENLSLNTAVSAFMICVNELIELKCNKRDVLEPLLILLSPFAPHVCEELWEKLGHQESITRAPWPEFNASLTAEDTVIYPVQFNGKTRFNLELPSSVSKEEIEKAVLAAEHTHKYLAGNTVKKVIVVPKRIVNVVF